MKANYIDESLVFISKKDEVKFEIQKYCKHQVLGEEITNESKIRINELLEDDENKAIFESMMKVAEKYNSLEVRLNECIENNNLVSEDYYESEEYYNALLEDLDF